jgi:hypothetical protein
MPVRVAPAAPLSVMPSAAMPLYGESTKLRL